MVLLLAVGFGTFTAMLSLYDGVVRRALPLEQPEELVQLQRHERFNGSETRIDHFTLDELTRIRQGSTSLACLVAIADGGKDTLIALHGSAETRQLRAFRASPNLLECLGTHPVAGRDLIESSEVLISSGLWGSLFDRQSAIFGTELAVAGENHRIVGVTPEALGDGSRSSVLRAGADLWMPLDESAVDPGDRSLRLIGRLKSGRTAGDAAAELVEVLRSSRQPPEESTRISVIGLRERLVEQARKPLRRLIGAAVLVLVAAFFNAVALYLATLLRNRRELEVRAAVGADRLDLYRLEVRRTSVAALASWLVGTLLAALLIRWVTVSQPELFPRLAEARLSIVCLGWGSAVAAIVAFALPAFGIGLLGRSLRGEASGATYSASASRRLLGHLERVVQLELAVSMALLCGAALLVQSAHRHAAADFGFDPDDVLVLDVHRPIVDPDFYVQVKQRIAALPGVLSVAVGSSVPFRPRDYQYNGWRLRKVDESFFSTLKMPIVRGRTFTKDDGGAERSLVVVDAALARRYFPGRDPVGLYWAGTHRIVGVVESARFEDEVGADPVAYVHHRSEPDAKLTLLVRSSDDSRAVIAAVREIVRSVDPTQPLANAATLTDLVEASPTKSRRRLFLMLLTGFAVASTFLVVSGIYAMTGVFFATRRRELAIRIALGAMWRDVLLLVARRCLRGIRHGIILGVPIAVGTGIAISDVLYQTAIAEPVVLAGAAIWLIVLNFVVTCVQFLRNLPALQRGPTR